MARSGVRRDGEHHNDNASEAIGDFLGDRDRILSLRLHPHAQTNEEALRETRLLDWQQRAGHQRSLLRK